MQKIIFLLIALSLSLPTFGLSAKSEKREGKSGKVSARQAIIWQQPKDIRSRNLFYGPGGRAGQPEPPFRFIEEDLDGTNPKFVVEDAQEVRWKVKLGAEAKPETAATRLLWAVGYFADVNYYFPQLQVAGMRKLSRGQKYVSPEGIVYGARLEHSYKKKDTWSWFDNPFIGTREFNGLRVMMALMNKWDLKESNNAVYQVQGGKLVYYISDLGDTFGKTGSAWTRSRGDVTDYVKSDFIDDVDPQTVDLVMHSRPPFLYAVDVPYYIKRTKMEKVADDIPRAHARWIGEWLGQLSSRQIWDAFIAAGYTPYEAQAYANKVRQRIIQLREL
jgi:hypothetical protein